MVARHWGVEFTGTLNPPVPVLKAGHPVPTALLMNVSVVKCVGCGVLFFYSTWFNIYFHTQTVMSSYPFMCLCIV